MNVNLITPSFKSLSGDSATPPSSTKINEKQSATGLQTIEELSDQDWDESMETKWNKLLTQLDVCQAINSSVLALSPFVICN